ncbi:ATP-binding protein [Lutimonas halocynthiae]|uniref:tetratricopeptide repeat-containing sensor histidine kinase n=1 Tax=Lutimonas halocynthiae TaxID=1446477 RepID=UPI0025B39BA5|nr:tetratricopeptide repeat-containing sensor histidine kinase [Lutimonas halocynthiae]MDN3643770.1 ATP-binding protein [Lutimonas halocynthiae]
MSFLKRTLQIALKEENDSVKVSNLLRISDQLYSLNSDSLFEETNKLILKIALKVKDTKAIAEYHWNIGNMLADRDILDSAYYHYVKSRNFYSSIGHEYYKSKMDYNLSFLEFRVKNYVQSEISVISAINGFKSLERKRNLFLCYNRLLIIDKELGNYDSAVYHFRVATELLSQLESKSVNRERLLNNLSLVYQKQEKYELAIKTLDQALENDELKKNHLNLYAKLIDNRAFCMFLNEQDRDVYPIYMEALKIREQANDRGAEVISRKHLAYYFLKKGDSLRAYKEAKIAYDISNKLGLNRDILENLHLLSVSDPKNSISYMNRYISLNDSLLFEERKIRDKFTRIQFETENYIAANEELKRKNVWISLTSGFGIFSLGLFFFLYRQRSKNRTLILESQHHQDNEEIYDLMLKQQNKTEEGRIQERIRISQELHDGILARLFSVRMGLGFLNIGENIDDITKYDAFMKELQLVEKEIRTLSHELKADDLSSKKDFTILLSELLKEQSTFGQFKYELDADKTIAWNRVDEAIKINLYRIAQEAIFNIIKYAKAQKVIVSLRKKKENIELSIVDDGHGFDTNKKQKGIGLKNMHSRAKSIGADINIHSKPETGTAITLSISTKTIYHEAKE